MFWPQIPNIATVAYISDIPQDDNLGAWQSFRHRGLASSPVLFVHASAVTCPRPFKLRNKNPIEKMERRLERSKHAVKKFQGHS